MIEIDLADVLEPLVACRKDPDDVKLLSTVAGEKIDEVFIGLRGHFRAAGKVLEGKTEIPTPAEYLEQVQAVTAKAADVYRYMNFDQIREFSEVVDTVAA